jgi:hypothetical protein
MDLYLITIDTRKFCAAEIDILYLLMQDEDCDWTVREIASHLPYIAGAIWDGIQSLILSGILTRTDMTQTFSDIDAIAVTVTQPARAWLNEYASDIEAAFIMLNPDLFDVAVPAEA